MALTQGANALAPSRVQATFGGMSVISLNVTLCGGSWAAQLSGGTWAAQVSWWRSLRPPAHTSRDSLFTFWPWPRRCPFACDTADEELRLSMVLSPMAYPCPQPGYSRFAGFWFALNHARPGLGTSLMAAGWSELKRYGLEPDLLGFESRAAASQKVTLHRLQVSALFRFFARLFFGAWLFVFLLGSLRTLGLSSPRRHSPRPPVQAFQIPCGLARHSSPLVPRAPDGRRFPFHLDGRGASLRTALREASSPA